MNFIKNTLLLLLILFSCSSWSQSSEQLWLDFNPSYEKENGIFLFGDIGYRKEFGSLNWNRLVFRPGIKKVQKHYYLTGGVGNFITFVGDTGGGNRYEFRPFQGIGKNWPNGQYLKINHYARFEEKFAWNLSDGDFDFAFRVRYKFTLSYSMRTWLENHHNWWKIYTSFELFGATSQSENSIDEQTRLGVGIERSFSRNQRAKIETIWQKQAILFNSNAPVNAFYLRLRYYPNWDGKKSKTK